MTLLRAMLALILGLLALPRAVEAQTGETAAWSIEPLPDSTNGGTSYNLKTGQFIGTNGVRVIYQDAVLIADQVSVNMSSGEVIADGHVRIQRDEQIWVSDHIIYNVKTRQIESRQFRTAKPPVFARGEDLHGGITNRVYIATNAIVTTDDISRPAFEVRAKYIKIIPGQRIEARNAILYLEGVPVFYFPYYSRNLGEHANNFYPVPGYRSSYGPYVLTKYTWFLSEQLDGVIHMDYRERRGPGVGPDINYHLGPWGDGSAKYYYTHDKDPGAGTGADVPEDRQRVDFSYHANPATNLFLISRMRWQSDTNVLRDFFEQEYREDPQPNSFFEVNRFWQNFSLDTYVDPRLNEFLSTVERLPEVRLTGFRQELGNTPIYYESVSSMGYYEQLFGVTNTFSVSSNYAAARADTFHQLLLPETFFGWLNFTPRVGARYTYYSEASGIGATTDEVNRGVFNTGAELSFKVSKTWPEFQSQLLDADGLRHIIEPSVDYVYIPSPNYHPSQIPQFDTLLPSLRLLPIDFPDYNDIDFIESQSVLRLGLFNKLQTKRPGLGVANLVKWDLYTDWNLEIHTNQARFSDVYSDFSIRPRSWITLESMVRYDPANSLFRMAYHDMTLQPNDVWSWTIGHFYLHDDDLIPFTGLGPGNNLVTSTFFYRVNDNWGLRAYHRFNLLDGKMEEQAYSIYRDMRSFTCALTFRALENTTGPIDYGVAFTFSLKALPRYGLGTDIAKPYSLLGS
jgi:hypothetical protein